VHVVAAVARRCDAWDQRSTTATSKSLEGIETTSWGSAAVPAGTPGGAQQLRRDAVADRLGVAPG
jgi:hypothetical protein